MTTAHELCRDIFAVRPDACVAALGDRRVCRAWTSAGKAIYLSQDPRHDSYALRVADARDQQGFGTMYRARAAGDDVHVGGGRWEPAEIPAEVIEALGAAVPLLIQGRVYGFHQPALVGIVYCQDTGSGLPGFYWLARTGHRPPADLLTKAAPYWLRAETFRRILTGGSLHRLDGALAAQPGGVWFGRRGDGAFVAWDHCGELQVFTSEYCDVDCPPRDAVIREQIRRGELTDIRGWFSSTTDGDHPVEVNPS